VSQDDIKERDAADALIAKAARSIPPAPRRDDPADDVLLRVVDGTATLEERAEVAAAGPYTRARLGIVRESLSETGQAVPAVVRAARYVFVVAQSAIDFLRGPALPIPAVAAAAVRGEAAKEPEPIIELRHAFDDMDTRIKVEHVVRGGAPTIDLQMKSLGPPKMGARFAILRSGKTVDNVPIEADGTATVTALVPDRYTVEMRYAGAVVGAVELDFLRQ